MPARRTAPLAASIIARVPPSITVCHRQCFNVSPLFGFPKRRGMSMRSFDDAGHLHYLQSLAAHPPLDRQTELALANRWVADGDRAAARALLESHLRFVVKIAHGFRGYGVPVADLVGEGNLGLIE